MLLKYLLKSIFPQPWKIEGGMHGALRCIELSHRQSFQFSTEYSLRAFRASRLGLRTDLPRDSRQPPLLLLPRAAPLEHGVPGGGGLTHPTPGWRGRFRQSRCLLDSAARGEHEHTRGKGAEKILQQIRGTDHGPTNIHLVYKNPT